MQEICNKLNITRNQYKSLTNKTKFDGKRPIQEINFDYLSEKDKAYIGGIIDGEGSIQILQCKKKKRINYRAAVSVSNTNSQLIIYLFDLLKIGSIQANERQGNRKILYQFTIYGYLSFQFLHMIYDYLLIKKNEADIIFELEKITNFNRRKNKEDSNNNQKELLYNKLKKIHFDKKPFDPEVLLRKSKQRSNDN